MGTLPSDQTIRNPTNMCLIVFDWRPGGEPALVLAANRDEFHARAAEPLSWWQWPRGPLAGRDVQAGGTWLAVSRSGRFAAVTNFRQPGADPGRRSRGELPRAWLESDLGAQAFAAEIHDRRAGYGPFNLIFGDPGALWNVGTHAAPQAVAPGIHALSNHLLDTPWSKASRCGRRLAERVVDGREITTPELLDLLHDRDPAPDSVLPETGLDREAERLLSAPFIVSPDYGTRSSTALLLGRRVRVAERSFGADGAPTGEVHFGFHRGD